MPPLFSAFVLSCAACVVTGLPFGCAPASQQPYPLAARQAQAKAPPSPVASFASRAPAHSRLLFSAGNLEALSGGQLEAFSSLFPECKLQLATVERVKVAIAEPLELRIELEGSVSLASVTCLLDALVTQKVLQGGWLHVTALPHGVRVASAGAMQDGPGAARAMAQRFEELSTRSKLVFLADLGPGGTLYEGVGLANGEFEARIVLSNTASARSAAEWLTHATSASRDDGLNKVKVSARAQTLELRLPSAGPELAVALRREVLEAFRTPSASMAPALLVGDHVMALKAEHDRPPERGELVVFKSPQERTQSFVKRVIVRQRAAIGSRRSGSTDLGVLR